jgi:hypothetical protein
MTRIVSSTARDPKETNRDGKAAADHQQGWPVVWRISVRSCVRFEG